MFEIMENTTVERLRLFFPNKEERAKQLKNLTDYKLIQGMQQKIRLDIEYLDSFKKRYPEYEYEVHFEKDGLFKSKPVGFSVWTAWIEREVGTDQYIYSSLKEVEEKTV